MVVAISAFALFLMPRSGENIGVQTSLGRDFQPQRANSRATLYFLILRASERCGQAKISVNNHPFLPRLRRI